MSCYEEVKGFSFQKPLKHAMIEKQKKTGVVKKKKSLEASYQALCMWIYLHFQGNRNIF